MLGNGYVEAFCFDPQNPQTRLCHIRGKMRKKVKTMLSRPLLLRFFFC